MSHVKHLHIPGVLICRFSVSFPLPVELRMLSCGDLVATMSQLLYEQDGETGELCNVVDVMEDSSFRLQMPAKVIETFNKVGTVTQELAL